MGLTVSYGATQVLSTEESGTWTLNTAGRWMENNITVTADGLRNLNVTYGGSSIISTSAGSGTWTLNTAGKFVTGNVGVTAEAAPAYLPYLTFSSPSEFTLKTFSAEVGTPVQTWDGTLEYSTDTVNWTAWTGAAINSSGGKLYLRGSGNTKITGSTSFNNGVFRITGANVSCIGNIETLLDYATVAAGQHPIMGASCFGYLFSLCSALVSAPELPGISLSSNCYYSMFNNTGLTGAPELPAVELTPYCYALMFQNCTAMTAPPVLPAAVMANYCYQAMFEGCTSLATAPALPAMTLASYCYWYMFRGCTALTAAPALPATTLAADCYDRMFTGCTSLVTLPALPATALTSYCYYYMFNGCTALKLSATRTGAYQYSFRIPTSGTGTTQTNYYAMNYMFEGTGGTFTGTPSINTTYYTDHAPV